MPFVSQQHACIPFPEVVVENGHRGRRYGAVGRHHDGRFRRVVRILHESFEGGGIELALQYVAVVGAEVYPAASAAEAVSDVDRYFEHGEVHDHVGRSTEPRDEILAVGIGHPELLSGYPGFGVDADLLVGKFRRKRQPVGHVGGKGEAQRGTQLRDCAHLHGPAPHVGGGPGGGGTQIYADVYAEGVFRLFGAAFLCRALFGRDGLGVKDRLVPCLFPFLCRGGSLFFGRRGKGGVCSGTCPYDVRGLRCLAVGAGGAGRSGHQQRGI